MLGGCKELMVSKLTVIVRKAHLPKWESMMTHLLIGRLE
jgi:hypothetical protein